MKNKIRICLYAFRRIFNCIMLQRYSDAEQVCDKFHGMLKVWSKEFQADQERVCKKDKSKIKIK